MKRIAIFLRGINLGNRRLRKEELLAPFVAAGFTGAESFIASGNVVIDDPGRDLRAVEETVAGAVREAFGFEADAFARTFETLGTIAEDERLVSAEEDGFTPHVILLRNAPSAAQLEALAGLETPDDRFPALGREILWLRRGRLTDSAIEPRHLERALDVPNTMRKVTTLRRMVRKFGG